MSEEKTIPFRIRRQYFDEIVAGTKRYELRAFKEYWAKRLIKWLLGDPLGRICEPQYALFICGKRKHKRRIVDVFITDSPEKLLGRELPEQGRKDLQLYRYSQCIVIELGEEICLSPHKF